MLIDLHVHTAYSEEFDLSLTDAITRCREAGISALLLTECDVAPPLDEVREIAEKENFKVFIGMDVDAADGRAIVVPRDPADDRFKNQCWADKGDDFRVRDVIRAVAELDGTVLATHPYLDDGGAFLGDRIGRLEELAGIEIVCGLKNDLSNDLALEVAHAMSVPGLGGSDTGPEGQRLGRFATIFADEIETQEELVDALVEGTFWAVELSKADPDRPRRPRRPPRDRGRGRGRGRGGGRGGRGRGGNRGGR